jgi:hypothetical protein
VTVATFAWFTMVSSATLTDSAQSGSVLPGAQVAPVVPDTMVADSTWLPGSGLATVTEKVTVADAPTPRSPVHDRVGEVNDTVPVLAAPSPL